ncbi:hypothetical protein F5Y18DRAFT_420537 [Xylariaceae sp. FL1019]|nr:hypothetical protein F5Y18DRAFT_420537 [Xylariaceae sp. FL1019]
MSHFSGSHSPVTGEPQPLDDESPPPPSVSPTRRLSTFAANKSPYASGNPSAIKSDFFHRRGHSRAASSPISFSAPSSALRVDHDSSPVTSSPISAADHSRSRSRSNSRPLSMLQAYNPPRMDVNEDTIPELQPIFTFLNSHANKLYQEGYFLKLDDQNTQGKPNADRTWTECFAQLVGTVLSLWDAAELDAAGENGEVLPKFINLTDASIKMIESLPTRTKEEQPLQNILSLSTAGRNRYLLHFNSRHSLIQWTAGIRLAMFEHSTLQEAYTGALIAGKGKTLNNIGLIMERSRMPMDQWVRVRFGAGVPWRRCWCVISPPDEKEYQKVMKDHKKKNPYDRSHPPLLKGNIKFYDQKKEGKRQKKMQPIATINDAYSAYALYPQSKSLIDASTLIKIEGDMTIHAEPPSTTEGFVFIMPEVNPAISGFEMMLRFLFPTWDSFGLYGRPGRLVASVLDSRSLMFAMPKSKRYGYLELLDVSSLILTDESSGWNEREWRKKLKELTGTRMNSTDDEESQSSSRTNSRAKRLSFGVAASSASKPRVGFADDAPSPPSGRASRSMSLNSGPTGRNETYSPRSQNSPLAMGGGMLANHTRNTSDPAFPPLPPSQADNLYSASPAPGRLHQTGHGFVNDLASTPERASLEDDRSDMPMRDFDGMRRMQTPEPVSQPPRFSHAPGAIPNNRPYHSPEMRRANSRLSITTLNQLTNQGGVVPTQDPIYPESERSSEEQIEQSYTQADQRGPPPPVHLHANNAGMPTNNGPREALMANAPRSPGMRPRLDSVAQASRSPMNPVPPGANDAYRPSSRPKTPNSRPGTAPGNRPPAPPTHGPSQGSYPPSGYRGSPGMPPPGRGRGRPPPNMPPAGRGRGRGYSDNGPLDAYGGYPPVSQARGRTRPDGSLPPLNTSGSINRKPLPARSDSLQQRPSRGNDTPIIESASSGSLTGNRIDADGFGQVRTQTPGSRPRQGVQRYDTAYSQASSRYDDAASVSSPDYASSRPSTDTASSVERPRAGVLKTVGASEDSATPALGNSTLVPDFDFGPTLNYAAAPRSMTPIFSPPAPPQHSRSPAPRGHSPAPPMPIAAASPDVAHGRVESEDNVRRSVIWQPAATLPRSPSPGGPGLSAEEFVQQRAAAAAATPMYAHHRQSSSVTLSAYHRGTPTPPLGYGQNADYDGVAHSRNNSQDMLQRPGSRGAGELLQRPKSRELLQRPGSRGAGATLGGQAMPNASHLSAREQEHVARLTGQPLINMAGNKSPPAPHGAGLVGAIEAREREREQMKHGFSGQAAQQVIDQRQQHQQQQQQFAYHQQYQQPLPSPGLPPPSGMYSNMGRGMPPPSPGRQGFGMAPYGNAGAGLERDGQWANNSGFRSPPPGNLDARYLPPQGQPSPQFSAGAYGAPGAGQGQKSYPHHGQAF